jgi:23S rRNA (adenine2503-C2)-methyltransferase
MVKILREIKSEDNSVKYLIQLEDGNSIETLYMHDKDRKLTYHSTVCVSSQVGCSIGCKFCATGEQGFIRNLQVNEISEQVEICNEFRLSSGFIPIDAVVFAGMGEPLLNYGVVKAAVQDISSRFGIQHFELATVGIVPRIYDLIEDFKDSEIHIRINLSLHGSSDNQRSLLIPFTSTYGIKEIIQAAIDYANVFRTKVRIRYMLIKDFNDTDEDISRLIGLLKDNPLKLILSHYNDNNISGLTPTEPHNIQNFYNKIKGAIDCEIFHNFGSDIQGGCGQLRRKERAVL